MSVDELQPAAATLVGPETWPIEAGDLMADEAPTAPRPAPTALPVRPDERFASVDVLRGLVLCGILAMNIASFAWPGPVYMDPRAMPGYTKLDVGVWAVNHVLFDTKMMTIFSMLFGAGLVLMGDRAERRGARLKGVFYRRVLWLLAIGLVHSYLIWDGDILVLYAECGLLIYPFRHKSPRTLIALGLGFCLLVLPVMFGFGALYQGMKAKAQVVDTIIATELQPPLFRPAFRKAWDEKVLKNFRPDAKTRAESFDKELRVHRGGYAGIAKERAGSLVRGQTLGFLLGGFLMAAGRMLMGMGLMKLGVFSAERSRRVYAWMVALGYGVGLPLVILDAYQQLQHPSFMEYYLAGGFAYNYIGSIIVALGHVGVVMLVVKAGALRRLTTRFAAMGRMALSNYLFQSILCTTLFYGYGLGLFGTIHRAGLAGIVAAIWALQLYYSPIWLRHFRFGPVEWLWRSLTYWKAQPMRAAVA